MRGGGVVVVCRTRDRRLVGRHHRHRTNLSRCISITIITANRSGGGGGAGGDGGRSGRRKAEGAERTVQLHVACKAAPDVSLSADPIPREPVRGAAARRRSGGPHPLPFQSLGAGEVQSVCVEVRPLGLVRATPDNVHDIGVDEDLVLVPGAGAVSGGGERCPRAGRKVESVGIVEVLVTCVCVVSRRIVFLLLGGGGEGGGGERAKGEYVSVWCGELNAWGDGTGGLTVPGDERGRE